jgi:Pyruvate/2-oxoacid:ferredoxin oxidoreductase delta subunit
LNPLRIKNIMPDHEASYITGPARNATPSCRYVLFNAGITLVSERTATARYAKFHHVFKKNRCANCAMLFCCRVAAMQRHAASFLDPMRCKSSKLERDICPLPKVHSLYNKGITQCDFLLRSTAIPVTRFAINFYLCNRLCDKLAILQ